MKSLEVNTGIGDRLARIMLSLPLAVVIVYFGLLWLFFIPFYLVVTGITGISFEYYLTELVVEKKDTQAAPTTGRKLAHH